MRDDERVSGQKDSVAYILIRFTYILTTAFVFYALSMGPAAKICWAKTASFDKIALVYAPLFLVAQHSTMFRDVLQKYLALWGLPD